MGGTFDGNPYINVLNDDNFHPVHLAEIDSNCDHDIHSECWIKTVTVSENHYEILDRFDTGYYPISASEIKTKLSSRQAI